MRWGCEDSRPGLTGRTRLPSVVEYVTESVYFYQGQKWIRKTELCLLLNTNTHEIFHELFDSFITSQ